MRYNVDDSYVRVDFFKPSGKWSTTESVKWLGYDGYIFDEFLNSLVVHFKDDPDRLSDMDAVCLKPYNKNSHPIQIKSGLWK